MIKQIWKHIAAVFIVLLMLVELLPVTSVEGVLSPLLAYAISDLPAAYSIEESELGEEHISGIWRYAVREKDGYAVVTGYDGSETAVSVPALLDGIDVVGLAENALSGHTQVVLHSNILYISENAFGFSKPEIISPNGSLGLYYAGSHGFRHKTGKDYDLVPGVLDMTDALPGRIQKRGDDFVALQPLEGCRLAVGSLFFMRTNRNMDYYYEVVSLKKQNDIILAEVRVPESGDFFVNYETELEVAMTASDFIPAEGTEVIDSTPSSKTVYETENSDTVSFTKKISGKSKKNWKFNGSVTVSSTNTVAYKVSIHNGVTTATEMTKKQTYKVDVVVGCSRSADILKMLDKTGEELAGLHDFDPVSKIGKIMDNSQLSFPFIGGTNASIGLSSGDLNEALKVVRQAKEKALDDSGGMVSLSLGHFFIQLPFCTVNFDFNFDVSVSGNINLSYTCTNVSKEHYDTQTDEWVVDYTRGNSSSDQNNVDVSLQGKGEVTVGIEISVRFSSVIKVLSAEFEIGVEAKIAFPTISVQIEPDESVQGLQNRLVWSKQCGAVTVDPFMRFTVYGGIWIGKQTGVKIEIYSKKWTLQELIGKEHLLHLHFNCFLPHGQILHTPDICPVISDVNVKYNTKTSTLLADRPIKKGGVLTQENYDLQLNNDPLSGKHLGWAFNVTDTEPTAFDNRPDHPVLNRAENYIVQNDITLYAVWEKQFTVSFDTDGGSTVNTQYVPRGGYAKMPSEPKRAGCVFIGWFDSNANEWNFDQDIVMENTVLTAHWENGEAEAGGTSRSVYIGTLADVSSDCLVDPGSPHNVKP